MAKDIDLMAKNAKTYNEPGSQVFKVAYLSWFLLSRKYNFLNLNGCSLLL